MLTFEKIIVYDRLINVEGIFKECKMSFKV